MFGLIAGLLICEIGLRIAGYSYPEFYAADEKLGYSLIPGMSGRYQKEGRSSVAINSDGFRDDEHTIQKPDNIFRIGVLGDSYAEAFQVEQEQAFWKVMEKHLAECGGLQKRKVEVLNFGVSGYGTAQEIITLREKVWKYQPDLVLLAVTTNNDITDNSKLFKKAPIPYFELRDGRLELDESFHDTPAFKVRSSIGFIGTWLSNHLRFVQAIRRGLVGIKYLRETRKRSVAVQSEPGNDTGAIKSGETGLIASDIGIDNAVYIETQDEKWESAWRVSEELISLMNTEVRAKGAEFLVVTLSNGIQVWPDPQVRTAYARKIGAMDLLYPDRRIETFCKSRGINVLSMAPKLADYAAANQVFLHGFGSDIGNGHWNADGHLAAGEMLSEYVCSTTSGDTQSALQR
ncbi:MAG: SGNH/GDSL hydrolase family protein [Pyrinomonadaceae bacterium]